MEEPFQEDVTTCKSLAINLVMADGSDGLLLPLQQVMGDVYPENPSFSLIEDPYENNSVTCSFPVMILLLICLGSVQLQ